MTWPCWPSSAATGWYRPEPSRRYSPLVLGAVGGPHVRAARLLVATGLVVSAALLSVVGGGWGAVIGAVQAALGAALVLWPHSSAPLGGAVLAVAPVPLAAARHWTAGLPGACRCARLPHPPPPLVSLTGLAVTLDIVLLALILWLAAALRHGKVGKSSS